EHQCHARLSTHPRVPVLHVRRRLLVTRGDEIDPAARKRVEYGDVGVATEPEDHLDAVVLELFDQHLGARGPGSPGCARRAGGGGCTHLTSSRVLGENGAFTSSSPQGKAPEVNRLQVGEVLDHPARALATDAGGLDSSKGQMIDPKLGGAVHAQATAP